jgi:hypothetical protein
MKLNDLMQKLAAFEPNGFPVLSIYLNAEANQVGRDDFGVWLKESCRNKATITKRIRLKPKVSKPISSA